jgi:NAD(P)-dependent dehydrogenase (short-subunit alcohol dehydrogenase family)
VTPATVSTDRFDGRRALVTGGASGIGRASAALLHERGAAVAILDRDAELVKETAAALGAVTGVAADVRDAAAVRSAIGLATDGLGGPPDALVNAVGVYRVGSADDLDEAEWDEVLETNLRGTFVVAQEFVRTWRADGSVLGSGPVTIVNMASTAALVADPGEPAAHYNASKAGVVALTKQLAVEWASYVTGATVVVDGGVTAS